MTYRLNSAFAGQLHEADFCSISDPETVKPELRKEKRCSRRITYEEPVVLETKDGKMIGAVVMNYGKDGLYFESDLKAPQGTILRIRNETTLACSKEGGCRAEVRWSRRLPEQATDYQFGTGVRYC